jgi:hypothetical protein
VDDAGGKPAMWDYEAYLVQNFCDDEQSHAYAEPKILGGVTRSNKFCCLMLILFGFGKRKTC